MILSAVAVSRFPVIHLARTLLVGCLAVTPAAIDRAAAQDVPSFGLPVDCVIGTDCHVQFFVDRDPGPGSLDYTCGSLSYDGHKGTDIRVPDLVTMERGVAVLAAGDGIIRAIRDGMPDVSLNDIDPAAIASREAGNAVVIAHPGGWETQYGHLRQGSVLVRSGDRVTRGQPLGLIGMSGKANYPHVHFEVRHDGETVDPFTGETLPTGCDMSGNPLWTDATLTALAYRPSGVLIAGFADVAPDRHEVRAGAHRVNPLRPDSAALVFWVDVFGTQAGDEEVFRVYGPDQSLLVEHRSVLEKNAHQRFNFVGKKRPDGGWPPGVYTGTYTLIREIDGTRATALSARRPVAVE